MFFKNRKKIGDLYAINTGLYAGCFFVYVRKNDGMCGFLSIPKMENVWATEELFDIGVKEGIIEHVERVPKGVRKTVSLKFEENEGKLPVAS